MPLRKRIEPRKSELYAVVSACLFCGILTTQLRQSPSRYLYMTHVCLTEMVLNQSSRTNTTK